MINLCTLYPITYDLYPKPSTLNPKNVNSKQVKEAEKLEARAARLRAPSYLTERINYMVFLKSIHPQTRQLNLTIPFYRVKLTGLWVN